MIFRGESSVIHGPHQHQHQQQQQQQQQELQHVFSRFSPPDTQSFWSNKNSRSNRNHDQTMAEWPSKNGTFFGKNIRHDL